MQNSAAKAPSLVKLGKLANSKQFDALEDAWPQAVAFREYRAQDLLPIAGQVSRLGDLRRAEGMVDVLLDHLEERDGPEEALAAARLAAGQIPRASQLRQQMARLYLKAYGDFTELEELLGTLIDDRRPLDEAVALVDRYLQRRPGAFVIDHEFLVPGIVERLDPANGVLTARFDDRHQQYGPSTLNKIEPRSADYFPALVLYDPERLRDLAGADVLGFVELALRSDRDRQIRYRDLKQNVILLLGEKEWKRWWSSARETLRHASRVTLSGGSQPTIKLLRQEDRYEDRLRRSFQRQQDPVRKLQLVLGYLDETDRAARGRDGYAADSDLLVEFGNGAAKVAVSALQEDPTLALAGLAVHAAVAERGVPVARPNPRAAVQVAGRITNPAALVTTLPEPLLLHTLTYLHSAVPDEWAEIWAGVLLRAGRRLSEVIVRTLIEEDKTEELQRALAQAVQHPTGSPDLICWLWRARHTASTEAQLARFASAEPAVLARSLLGLIATSGQLYSVSGQERHQKALEGGRNALALQKAQPMNALLAGADRDVVIELMGLIEGNQSLGVALRTQLLGQIQARYPELFVTIDRPWEDEDAIYTTEKGLRLHQEQFDQIITKDMPEVAIQIGEAASFGDLSENAEWTAALEKRDQLASRAKGMENDLMLARVITEEMATSDHVNVGTRVTARNLANDATETFVFLGPWDTEIEDDVMNYRAPLALAFMGKLPGEEVVYGEDERERRWEIITVEPAK